MNFFLHLLQLLVFLLCFKQSLCFSATQAMVLPLKTETGVNSQPSNKLSFHHNVTLTVELTVGSPPQAVTMVLDTGSELPWLNCKKKTQTLTSVFNPLSSSSYSRIPCISPICQKQTRDLPNPVVCDEEKLCNVFVSYADGSSLEGNLASDTFRIGSLNKPGTLFGCMGLGSSSNPQEDAKTTGLMGMNRGSLSFVTQLGLSKFSYCISGRDSSGVLILGEGNHSWVGNMAYTPLVQMSTPLPSYDRFAYTVKLEGIKVGNKILALEKSILVPDHTGAGQTMVDSGTQFTFLLGPVYTALKNEFLVQTKGVLVPLGDPNFVFQGALDSCFRVPANKGKLPPLPTVSLMLNGAEMVVGEELLLYRVPGMVKGGDWVYCMTFGNSDLLGIAAFVIGNHHQQNLWMEYDLAKSRLGFVETRCDSAGQRLGLDL
ncbi:Aspartic proteinase PCS1, partial [Cucurbita argyrosperma subsp. argyrosperma]